MRDKVTRQCPQTTFEEKGEPKQIRTEIPPLTPAQDLRQDLTVLSVCAVVFCFLSASVLFCMQFYPLIYDRPTNFVQLLTLASSSNAALHPQRP